MRDKSEPRALAIVERLAVQGADQPGVAVSVIRGGDVIVRRYAGLASLEPRIPIGPATRFHIVSVSKTFVAAAVLVWPRAGRCASTTTSGDIFQSCRGPSRAGLRRPARSR